MAQQIIDTHIHCWNFSYAEYDWLKNDTSNLNRTYDIEELETERIIAGITGGVLVQSANNSQDTDWMLKVAGKTAWIKGVVGWLPLMDPAATFKAFNGKYIANKYFKGVRHLIHDEADPEWLLQNKVLESLKLLAENNLPYDVVGILPAHIKTALKVAENVPGLKMVFDHLNQPPISSGEKFGAWGELMTEAANNENLYIKISGMGTTTKKPGWTPDDIKPYIEFVLKHFGDDRCMCGGDWPVSLLAGNYTKTWDNYKKVFNSLLTEDQKARVYHTNAVQFYNL